MWINQKDHLNRQYLFDMLCMLLSVDNIQHANEYPHDVDEIVDIYSQCE